MDGTSYTFQVSIWMKEEPSLKFLGQAYWIEMCRCNQEWKAREIAECLALRQAVQVAQLVDQIFVPFLWIPDNPEANHQ